MLPTDRGYVLVERQGDTSNVRIFSGKAKDGSLVGEFATHSGLRDGEFSIEIGTVVSGEGLVTVEPAEVFLADDDNVVHIRPVTPAEKFAATLR